MVDFLKLNSGAAVVQPGPGAAAAPAPGQQPGAAAPAAAPPSDPTPPAGEPPQGGAPQPPGAGGAPGQPAPAGGGQGQQQQLTPQEIFSQQLIEMTGGAVKTPEDFKALLQQHQDFQQRLAKPPEPTFASEKAKKAFEMISKMPGDDAFASMQRYFHVVNLPTDKMEPKELMFEGFMLREENADLDRDRGRRIFEAEYNELYGQGPDPEKDPLAARKHELAIKQSAQAIKQIQDDYNNAKGPFAEGIGELNPEEIARYKQDVEAAAKAFKEVKVRVGDKDVSVLFDAKEVGPLQDYAFDPKPMWDAILKQFDKGDKFDVAGYMQRVAQIMYPEKFYDIVHKSGVEAGKQEILTQFQNPGRTRGTQAAAAPAFDDKFYAAWAGAEQGKKV